LIQPTFVAELTRVLKNGGLIHLATDWADYAAHARAVFAEYSALEPVPLGVIGSDPRAFRAPTKFELRGRSLGHEVVDLCYRKVAAT
jgi:tRNA (guanine-N7-)-methyltransferase